MTSQSCQVQYSLQKRQCYYTERQHYSPDCSEITKTLQAHSLAREGRTKSKAVAFAAVGVARWVRTSSSLHRHCIQGKLGLHQGRAQIL